MRPFWRAALFLTPLAIVFGTPELVLWLGGELTNPDTVVRRQATDRQLVLHGPAYTNSAPYVKKHGLLALQAPQVVALGNSRVLQFRREFFRPDVSFYNSGSAAVRLLHFRAFLESLPPEELPETLLIATDTGYFNTKFDQLDKDGLNVTWMLNQIAHNPTAPEVFLQSWWTVWKDIAAGKIKWARLFSFDGLRNRVGLTALCAGAGYRNDGSYQYGTRDLEITNPQHSDYHFAKTLGHIAAGEGRFPWGDTPSAPALKETDALLDFCAAHHVYVIGFLPPHAHAVWMAMQGLGERYAYIPKLERELRARFESRGFEFYDFPTSPRSVRRTRRPWTAITATNASTCGSSSRCSSGAAT